MQSNVPSLPDIGTISRLIDTLRDYALRSAHEQWGEHMSETYLPPRLDSWDAFAWFELSGDWQVVDYLLSDTNQARRLMNSLQSCLQWYGQQELDERLLRMRIAN